MEGNDARESQDQDSPFFVKCLASTPFLFSTYKPTKPPRQVGIPRYNLHTSQTLESQGGKKANRLGREGDEIAWQEKKKKGRMKIAQHTRHRIHRE